MYLHNYKYMYIYLLFKCGKSSIIPTGYKQSVTVCGSYEVMSLLLNENLCKQRDPHIEVKFDFYEKHIP